MDVKAAEYWLVSSSETHDYWHAFGWVFAFNFFFTGLLLVPFIHKKIIHFFFVVLLVLSAGVAYLIVHCYQLSVINETSLVALCFIPALVVYGNSILIPAKKRQALSKVQKRFSFWSIVVRHSLHKGISMLYLPFVFCCVYLWKRTPRQRRKEHLRKLGWNVDAPDVFADYLILHRRKNPLLTCAVSHRWKHIPINRTRSLGLLSLETQHEVELILELLKIDFAKLCEKENLLMNKGIIVFEKRTYALKDILSRIERKTPLGIRFLRKYLQKTMEETFNQRKTD
jgi:hypothetical protein